MNSRPVAQNRVEFVTAALLGVPLAPSATEFADVIRKINELHDQGFSLNFIDFSDTFFHLTAYLPPIDWHSPLLACSIWKDEVSQRASRLRDHGQNWIAVRSLEARRKYFVVQGIEIEDTFDALQSVLDDNYDQVSRVGTFDFWRRKSLGSKVPAIGLK